jgi:hypothetical protein
VQQGAGSLRGLGLEDPDRPLEGVHVAHALGGLELAGVVVGEAPPLTLLRIRDGLVTVGPSMTIPSRVA